MAELKVTKKAATMITESEMSAFTLMEVN